MDLGFSYINFTPSLGSAPSAIDELARRQGDTGTLTFLASFFKSPYGVKERGFVRQFHMLEASAGRETRG